MNLLKFGRSFLAPVQCQIRLSSNIRRINLAPRCTGAYLGAKVRQVNALRKDHSPRRGRFLVIFWTTEKRAKNKVKFMREKRPFSTDGRSHLSPAESFAHPY